MYAKHDWCVMGSNPMVKGLRVAGFVVLGILAAGLFALVFGYLVMVLWNWIMPAVFGLTTVTYWQAFGLIILVKLIFGTIGRGKNHERRSRFDRFSRRNGTGEDDEGEQGKSHRDWRVYRDFWQDVGEDALRAYMARRESEARGGDGGAGEDNGGDTR
jgi:hypothetical protein